MSFWVIFVFAQFEQRKFESPLARLGHGGA
jgi:hypothetical protein